MKNIRVWAAVSTLLASSGVLAKGVDNGAEIDWSIESGLGYETNAYHAPDHDYFDFYAGVPVTPNEQAGAFIPLKVKAEILKPVVEHIALSTKYRFSGYYYPQSALNDASSTDHEINVGAEIKLGDQGKSGDAYAGLVVRSHDKVYVDHDSGEPKTSGAGVDVSNRYTYKSFGIEGDYEREIDRNSSAGVEGILESLDYEDPVAWKQYDHTHISLRGFYERRLRSSTKLKAGLTTQLRQYSDRHAYSADGTLPGTNPLLTYTYMIVDLGLRHRFTDDTVAYFDYELLQRRDNHVGYNDMNQNSLKVRVIHDLNEKMRLRAKVRLYDRDYPSAFNFEDPALGSKSASGSDLQLKGEYQWNKHKSYFVELENNSRKNTDDRYQYNNSMIMLGAKWEY